MATYAVTARLGRVEPRLAVHSRASRLHPDGSAADVAAVEGPVDAPVDVIDAFWDDPFSERLDRWHERWAQATFFLFDSESWRR